MASEFEHYFDLDGGYKVLRSSSGNYFVDTPDGKRISLDKNPNRWASMIEHIKQGDSFIAGTTEQAKQHLLNRLRHAGYIKPTPNASSIDDVIKDSSKASNTSANTSSGIPKNRAVTPGFSTPEAQANPYTTVGEPYGPNYMLKYKGSTNLPAAQSNTNVSSVGKPYGPTNLPAEYVGTNVVPYTGNGAVAEPSLLSRAGNFLGNAAKAGLKALPFLGAGYELFENNNLPNAVSVAGSALSPLSLLFYSNELADGTLSPEMLKDAEQYAQAKKIAPLIGTLESQAVNLPVDPLAGIDRENKWTPNLTSGETKKTAAPRRKQVQSAPATTSVDSIISTPSDREQVMARRAVALQRARNDSAAAAAQQPNFDWHYYNYVKNNLGYRSDASALQYMGYNRDQLNQFLDPNGRLRTSYIPEGFMVGR